MNNSEQGIKILLQGYSNPDPDYYHKFWGILHTQQMNRCLLLFSEFQSPQT